MRRPEGPPIIVRARGDYFEAVGDALPDIRQLTNETLGKPVRRIGRFIQLALIGAARCVGGAKPPPETAVYIGSRRGDLEVTIEVMEQVFRDGQAPKPLSFINTVSNAACFYVARHFELHGRSSYASNVQLSYETALAQAALDMEAGAVRSALVGVVDHALAPLDVHRRRLRLEPGAPIAEASHWLWLEAGERGVDGAAAAPLARLGGAELFPSRERLDAWIAAQGPDGERTLFAPGQFLEEGDVEAIARTHGLTRVWSPSGDMPYTDSRAGYVAGEAIASRDGGRAEALLQVNADGNGGYAAVLLRRSPK